MQYNIPSVCVGTYKNFYLIWILPLEEFFLSDISEFPVTPRKSSKCYNFIFPKRRSLLVLELPQAWSFYFSRRRQPPVAAIPLLSFFCRKRKAGKQLKHCNVNIFSGVFFSHLLRANYLQNGNDCIGHCGNLNRIFTYTFTYTLHFEVKVLK